MSVLPHYVYQRLDRECISKFVPRVLADHNQQVNSKMCFTSTIKEKNITIPPAVFIRTNYICISLGKELTEMSGETPDES